MFFLVLLVLFVTKPAFGNGDWLGFSKSNIVPAKKLQGDILLDNPFYTLEIEGEVEQPFLVRGFNFRQEDKEIHKGHHAFPAAPFIATMFTNIDNEKLQVLFAAKLPVSVKNILPEYLKASDHERDAVYNIVIQGAPGCQSDQPPVEIADTNPMVRRHTAGLKTQPYFLSKQCPDDTELPGPPPIINSLGDQLNLPSHSIQFLDTNNYFLKQYIPAMAETRMMGPKVDSPFLRWSNSKLFFSHTPDSCIGQGKSFDVVAQLWNENSAFWSKMTPKNQPSAPVYTLHILIQRMGNGLTVDKVLAYLQQAGQQMTMISFLKDYLPQLCGHDQRSTEVLRALNPVLNALLDCGDSGASGCEKESQSSETLKPSPELEGIKAVFLAWQLEDTEALIGIQTKDHIACKVITDEKTIQDDNDECVTSIYTGIKPYLPNDGSFETVTRQFLTRKITYMDVMPTLCKHTDFNKKMSDAAESFCQIDQSFLPVEVQKALSDTGTKIRTLKEFSGFIERLEKRDTLNKDEKFIFKYYLTNLLNVHPNIKKDHVLALIKKGMFHFHPDKSYQSSLTELFSCVFSRYAKLRKIVNKAEWDDTNAMTQLIPSYRGPWNVASGSDTDHLPSAGAHNGYTPSSAGPGGSIYDDKGAYGAGYYGPACRDGSPLFYGHPASDESIFYTSGPLGPGFYNTSTATFFSPEILGVKYSTTGMYGAGYYFMSSDTPPTFYGCPPSKPYQHRSDRSRTSKAQQGQPPHAEPKKQPAGGAGPKFKPSAGAGEKPEPSAGAGEKSKPAAGARPKFKPSAGAGEKPEPSAGARPKFKSSTGAGAKSKEQPEADSKSKKPDSEMFFTRIDCFDIEEKTRSPEKDDLDAFTDVLYPIKAIAQALVDTIENTEENSEVIDAMWRSQSDEIKKIDPLTMRIRRSKQFPEIVDALFNLRFLDKELVERYRAVIGKTRKRANAACTVYGAAERDEILKTARDDILLKKDNRLGIKTLDEAILADYVYRATCEQRGVGSLGYIIFGN